MYVNSELDLQFQPSIPPCTALTELERFLKFLTPSIVVKIVENTNNYAETARFDPFFSDPDSLARKREPVKS